MQEVCHIAIGWGLGIITPLLVLWAAHGFSAVCH